MAVALGELDPVFQQKVVAVLEACSDRGVRMVPSQAVRSPHEQARLWRQSRSRQQIDDALAMLRDAGAPYLAEVLEGVGPQEGRHVTNALPGNSWHQWGEAVDCFWLVDNAAEWSTTRKVNGVNGYHVYAEAAQAEGLDAGLFWTSLKDAPHLQLRATANPVKSGLSWAQVDQQMQVRFGPKLQMAPLALHSSSKDAIALSYEAPEGWRVYETADGPAVIFQAGMTICADGAPRAYHADNSKALDYLANAGRPGAWYGICTNKQTGEPLVQGPDDPAPGYYVSTTALNNAGAKAGTPELYVDADTIPYIVLPGGRYSGFCTTRKLRLGDVGLAYNRTNGHLSYAQCCEVGPGRALGEGSIALARALEINANAKSGGTRKREILYLVFPGSGPGTGLDPDEIEALARPLFEAWGGLARLQACETL